MALATMRILIAIWFTLAASSVCASCIEVYPILAKVEVRGCQPFMVGASPSKSKRRSLSRIYPDKQGSHVSGTLLKVRVLEEHAVSVSLDNVKGVGLPDSINGVEYVFVLEDVGKVCPESLPQEASVLVEGMCCDRLPREGDCLVPFTQAVIERNPERWFIVGSPIDGG